MRRDTDNEAVLRSSSGGNLGEAEPQETQRPSTTRVGRGTGESAVYHRQWPSPSASELQLPAWSKDDSISEGFSILSLFSPAVIFFAFLLAFALLILPAVLPPLPPPPIELMLIPVIVMVMLFAMAVR